MEHQSATEEMAMRFMLLVKSARERSVCEGEWPKRGYCLVCVVSCLFGVAREILEV